MYYRIGQGTLPGIRCYGILFFFVTGISPPRSFGWWGRTLHFTKLLDFGDRFVFHLLAVDSMAAGRFTRTPAVLRFPE